MHHCYEKPVLLEGHHRGTLAPRDSRRRNARHQRNLELRECHHR
jgi:hypothetical protein